MYTHVLRLLPYLSNTSENRDRNHKRCDYALFIYIELVNQNMSVCLQAMGWIEYWEKGWKVYNSWKYN